MKKNAFSLIELLVSLIIISLIAAAFSPIITKRFMARNLTLAGGINVPYDSKAFTEDTEWIVPDGIKKIRVYLTGAGGSGASAAPRLTEHFANLPALENQVLTLTTAGTYNFTTVPTSNNYKAPALPSGCSGNWTIVSGGSIAPNTKLNNYLSNTMVRLSKVTACGGSGAAGGGLRNCANGCIGGGGGYISNQALNIVNTASQTTLKVGSGGYRGDAGNSTYGKAGGSGGTGGTGGTAGAACITGLLDLNCYCGGGGGGGGSTAIINSGVVVFEISGGGGGGGSAGASIEGCTAYGGAGGQGGGVNAGLGGGRANCWAYAKCSPGAGGGGYIPGHSGNFTAAGVSESNGGSGGGGIGSNLAKIFNSNNCIAGGLGANGKPGAMQLTYSIDTLPNALKCQYTLPPYGSGGGGAGQVWIGEIAVNEGQKLNIKIGKGGKKQTVSASNGFDGGVTSISLGSSVLAQASGGKGGKYSSTSVGVGGVGGGLTVQKNWLNVSTSSGASGSNGTTSGAGGRGGSTYSNSNSFFQGAKGGGNGEDAVITNYGTGGGGGGSSASNLTFWGQGGKGADGFVYIEWKK